MNAGKSEEYKPSSMPTGVSLLILGFLIAGAIGIWQYKNRGVNNHNFGVNIKFLSAPDTLAAGLASPFVVYVEKKGDKMPAPDRIMDITVSPQDKAQIVSISGSSGKIFPKESHRATGRTDSSGRVALMIRATDPGKYTVVALDSTSNLEGTINFQVR